MQKHKMARWRLLLRKNEFRRRQIQSIRRLRHSRSRVARIYSAVLLTIVWLILPLLPGCSSGNGKPVASQSDSTDAEVSPPGQPASTNALPQSPTKNANPARVIQFRGVDNEYRGTTKVLPGDELLHEKEPND